MWILWLWVHTILLYRRSKSGVEGPLHYLMQLKIFSSACRKTHGHIWWKQGRNWIRQPATDLSGWKRRVLIKLQVDSKHPGGIVKGDRGCHGSVQAEAGQACRVSGQDGADVDADVVVGLVGVKGVVEGVELRRDESFFA